MGDRRVITPTRWAIDHPPEAAVEISAVDRWSIGSQSSLAARLANRLGHPHVTPRASLPHVGRSAVKPSAKSAKVDSPTTQPPMTGDSHHPGRSGRRWPLSRLMVVPFATQCLVVLAITSYVGLRSSRMIATDRTQALLVAIGRHIDAHLSRTLDAYSTIVRLSQHDVAAGHWSAQPSDRLEDDLWDWMQSLPTIDRLVFADPEGNLRGVSRVQGWRRLSSRGNAAQGEQQPLDDDGLPTATPQPYGTRPVQSQPWFTNGLKSDFPVWTGLGNDLEYQARSPVRPDQAFLHYSWALRQPQTGKLVGVMSADLQLLEVEQLLQSTELGDRARAFVFTDEGWLMASSGRQPTGPIASPEHLSKTADPRRPSTSLHP